MLVLSRRLGESLCIGKDITITVVSIKGNRVKIGIEAPRQMPVLREELMTWLEDAEGSYASADPASVANALVASV